MRKILLILSIFIGFSLVACNTPSEGVVDDKNIVDDNGTDDPVTDDNETDGLQLTLAELSMYDGMDGSDAYIAVNGVIYDVSDSSRWSGGEHNGYYAGHDLTEEINNISPHGVRVLDDLPVVGELIDD